MAEEKFASLSEEDLNIPKVSQIDVAGKHSKTFVFHKENHTLGNPLRKLILKDDRVDLAGYSIPHPMEPKMNIRIQTAEESGFTASDALEAGLDKLIDVCDDLESKLTHALSNH
eukprot:augustus_masked-scaffold_8-processed-gene-10.11-mRNA-1 protein AED:0.46 eAED:0.46 QI:0/-1/0/1/-1/1/1/0/113